MSLFSFNNITTLDFTQLFLTLGHIIGFMVLNATFNNISVISWRPVLLVEETEVPAWYIIRVSSTNVGSNILF
jgi:hypothetical protein